MSDAPKTTGPDETPPQPAARIPKLLIIAVVVLCLILIASIGVLPASALNLRPIYKAF